ncbi:hypothetical protein I309_00010 [Cryptococcus deuterogattii LA55]|nr:hypothetical protein I309_00010 [Cryptococcus deuterogattii LA55]KIR95246.1 hypothetical protein I304_01576 [Cryptococcus deuterogattii CBS 10090]
MVFGIIVATAICPAISATKQAIEGGIKGNRQAGNKALDLVVAVTFKGGGVGDPGEVYKGKFEGAPLVLGKDGKVYINHAGARFPPHFDRPLVGHFQSVEAYTLAWARVGHQGDVFVVKSPERSSSPSPSPLPSTPSTSSNRLKDPSPSSPPISSSSSSSQLAKEAGPNQSPPPSPKPTSIPTSAEPPPHPEPKSNSPSPPQPHHLYLNPTTHAIHHAPPQVAATAAPGPWSLTPLSHRILFEGWEGFVIVQESEADDRWALYFDRADNGLTGQGQVGDVDGNDGKRRRMLAIHLERKEGMKTKQEHESQVEERRRKREDRAKEREKEDDKRWL